jgi:hypothetical protein
MIYRADFKRICASLYYLEVIRYFKGLGWVQIPNKSPDLKVFQFTKDHLYQVIVPLDKDFDDYADAMYRIAEVAADAGDRSVEEIVLELSNPLSDIVRIRIENDDVKNGNILLDDAFKLFNNAKSLMTATAQDVVNPKKYYNGGRVNERVKEFIDNCRLGQTEIGSYIASVVCPFFSIDEKNKIQQLSLFTPESDAAQSLTRKVTKKLMDSLNDVEVSIKNGDDLEKLVDRRENRISINFLEALQNLNIEKNESKVNIGMKWAPTINENRSKNTEIQFTHSYYSPISTVTTKVKSTQEQTQLKFIGRLRKLSSSEDATERKDGIITIIGLDDKNNKKSIQAVLSKEDYLEAIKAHTNGDLVEVAGMYDVQQKKLIDCDFKIL